jgi:ribonuclease D
MPENSSAMPSSPVQVDPETIPFELAEKAVTEATMLGPDKDLSGLIPQWLQANTIGLDTEFVRERTFFPNPGLVQLSDGETIWLLDPLGRDDFPCFGQILDNSNIIKILHSVGEDLEIFMILTGTLPNPLFDTQIAAAMLGMPLQCRYEHLVEACFGAQLPGGQARSNWCQRPLSPSLLRYAAQDVIWLPRLQQELAGELDRRGRLAWLEEDCQRLVQSAADADSTPPLLRVKGAGRLDDQVLAWLAILADWREDQARERNLPRSFVIRDESMIELAGKAGTSELAQVLKTLPRPLQQRYGSGLRAMLNAPSPEPIERPKAFTAMDNEQRQALKQAQQQVRDLAEQLSVDPALLASKRELTRLVHGEKPDWVKGWRGGILAEVIGNLSD